MDLERKELPSRDEYGIQKQVESLLIKEPVGSVDASFLRSFYSSELFVGKVNQAIARIRKGMALGEVGFEAWRTQAGFEICDRKPLGTVSIKASLTPQFVLERLKAGQIEFLGLHFHPQHQEVILPSVASHPHLPPSWISPMRLEGDLLTIDFLRELHQVVTGYEIAPIGVVGGVNFKTGGVSLLFYQGHHKEARKFHDFRYHLKLKVLDSALEDVKDQAVGIELLRRVGYKVALIDWQGSFSDQDLEKLSQFVFDPTEIPWEERFDVANAERIHYFLEVGQSGITERLKLRGRELEEEQRKEVFRRAEADDEFFSLEEMSEEVEMGIKDLINKGKISNDEAEKLREALKVVVGRMSTFSKATVKDLVEGVVESVLMRVLDENPIYLADSQQGEIKMILEEFLDAS